MSNQTPMHEMQSRIQAEFVALGWNLDCMHATIHHEQDALYPALIVGCGDENDYLVYPEPDDTWTVVGVGRHLSMSDAVEALIVDMQERHPCWKRSSISPYPSI